MDIPPEVIAAVNAAQWGILALPGVTGIGVGLREENGEVIEELAVRVYVTDKSNVPSGTPDNIAGVATCLIEGSVAPVSADLARYSPLVGGIRIETPNGIGTLGAIVQDAQTTAGALLGLTAFHVAGDGHTDFPDTIWQPSSPPRIVGQPVSPADNIGRVTRFEFPRTQPLPFSPVVASAVEASLIDLTAALNQGRGLSPAIADLAFQRINATALPDVGRKVKKRGFVTGLTTGRIVGGPETHQWTAGPANSYLIEQYVVDTSTFGVPFALSGDSGSVVLDAESGSPTAVGLLWGSMFGGARGVFCAIKNVESILGINVAWV
jgi:hypothetical protein